MYTFNEISYKCLFCLSLLYYLTGLFGSYISTGSQQVPTTGDFAVYFDTGAGYFVAKKNDIFW